MKRKIHALLVGINTYSTKSVPQIPPSLDGCENDVHLLDQTFKSLAKDMGNYQYSSKILTNHQATRANVISAFQNFLISGVKAGDTVVYHFSGHGSYEKAPKLFQKYFSTQQLETQVLFDSREESKHDLADKEFAVLLSNIPKDVHIFISLDCCYSGSGVRGENQVRYHDGRNRERPLSSFLNNYFQHNKKIPSSSYIFFSSCSRKQNAREFKLAEKNFGVYSYSLTESIIDLKMVGDDSYKAIFSLLEAKLQQNIGRSHKQTPEMAVQGEANPFFKFLTSQIQINRTRSLIHTKDHVNIIDSGVITGIPLDTEYGQYPVLIYENQHSHSSIAEAKIKQVGFSQSIISPTIPIGENDQYYIDPINLLPKILVSLQGGGKAKLIHHFIEEYCRQEVSLVSNDHEAHFTISVQNDSLIVSDWATGKMILNIYDWNENIFPFLKRIFLNIQTWMYFKSLNNPHSRIEKGNVKFIFDAKGIGRNVKQPDKLDIVIGKSPIPYDFFFQNNGVQDLFIALIYLGPEFQIEIHSNDNEAKPPDSKRYVVDDSRQLEIPDNKNAEKLNFTAIVSQEYIGDSIFFEYIFVNGIPSLGQRVSQANILDQTPNFRVKKRGPTKRFFRLINPQKGWTVLKKEISLKRKW